ncbi:MAG: MFS transporter, partial [Candidatus Bathyarchaeota archaeon]
MKTKKWTYETTLVLLLLLGFGLAFMDRSRAAVLMPMIAPEFQATFAEAGLAIGIVGFTWGAFSIIGGSLSDRFGRKRILIPAMIIFSATSWIAGLARNIHHLTLVRGFMGIGEGTYLASSSAWVAEVSSPHRRGLNIGIIYLGATLFGSAIGPIVMTMLAASYGWRFPFMALAIPGFILAVVIWFLTHEPPSILEKRKTKTTRKVQAPKLRILEILCFRNMILCIILSVFYMPLHLMHLMYGPLFMAQVMGWDIVTIGQVMAFLGIGGAIGMVYGGRISDYIGRKLTVIISYP